jgi:hypothetical protein
MTAKEVAVDKPVNTLAAKIAKASHDVGALATDKHNKQGEYDYISADKILDRAGGALADNGLALIPSITGVDSVQGQTGRGVSFYMATVRLEMHLTDGTSEAYYPWTGMGVDYSAPDKAMYKAITSGHKYFIMKLLNVGVGNEDGEHESPPPAADNAGKVVPDVKANGKGGGGSTGNQPAATVNRVAPTQPAASAATPDLWTTWKSPIDAQNWAVAAGACADGGVAMGSWKRIVKATFPEKEWVSAKELPACYEAFYKHQVDKLLARQITVAAATEDGAGVPA